MVRSASISDQTPPTATALECVALDIDRPLAPQSNDLFVFVVPGACTVQRLVAGQWIDVQTMYRAGIVITRLSDPLRVSGRCGSGGIALRVVSPVEGSEFHQLAGQLEAMPALQLDADSVVDSLVHVLAIASRASAPCVRNPVIEALSLRLSVILRRLSHRTATKEAALPAWRVQRVAEFVEDRMDGAISLADMAAAAGLSPMHFAAQFKVATGMRPHHYLIGQRIDRAKQLLDGTDDTILNIAMAVGFQTQAHFATVFKQHENVTPRQWRGARSPRPQAVHRVRESDRRRRAVA